MRRKGRSFWSAVLFVALLLQTFGFTAVAQDDAYSQTSGAANVQGAATQSYGLPANTKDGLIFHAWNWSFDTITDNLPAIAAAGFKSVQTSPIQGTKENSMGGSYWWVLYQPVNFKIGNAQLGGRDQFKRLCEEAEKHGISIIVDVVANHMGNAGGGSLEYTPAYNVDPAIRNNPYFWHEARGITSYDRRWEVTQWGIGLPDLNTANQELQDMIIGFLNDAINLGADGFRFDAAKHIELPNDEAPSNFWPRVLGSLNNKQNLFNYGEVLQGGKDYIGAYDDYISVTASYFGRNVRHAVGYNSGKNVNDAKHFSVDGVAPNKLVTWVESHDSYANDSSESTYMNDWQIKMGWALIASRAETSSLFFNRPVTNGGRFANTLGEAGNNLWKDADIAAVNKFHNAMVGQNEYLRTQGNEIMLIDRGTKGTTIVNLGSDAQIDSATNLANGIYTNKASGGGTFTVSNGRITGSIGGGKIAVLYQGTDVLEPTVSIDVPEGGFYSDTLNVKMSYANADSATYSLNDGTPVSFGSGQSISIGTGVPFGSTFALKITAIKAQLQTTKTFTFVKENPNPALKVHYYKPSQWGAPNLYYYDDSVSPTKIGTAWPGVAMQSEGDGWYVYEVPNWKQAKVIFNSGGNQTPGANQPGYSITGEKWIKDGVVTNRKPDSGNQLVPVTFNVNNATTVPGQNIYIVGSAAELGNWNPANAIGPGANPNYPNWTITVNLPAGAHVQFKAVKKDANNHVVWESGSNHSYTVSASNPVVNFNFNN
ncbi:carbohydrate-binding module family 20 domain-containing protein [Cohnella cholangitidis]|uniref:carbohydrate-binding module family 20 domain-containing protein n=1 Tax=Cohnella cholangitidis TaxID=2598458 RepID=UPI0015FCA651|nr:carbohydrate-binding module family 20 domain-containing protein [Cohnella cholangitidis]